MSIPAFASSSLAINLLLFALGLLLLIRGSDWFVEGAAQIARRYQVSDLVIGLTLVSIGTSLPELGTNVYASLTKDGDIALGTIVGSNITNIGLILGIGILLLGKIPITRQMLRRDVTIMLLLFALLWFLCRRDHGAPSHGELGRGEGAAMLVLFALYLGYLFRQRHVIHDDEQTGAAGAPMTVPHAWWLLGAGLAMVFAGAKTLVDNTVSIATHLQVPKALIAITVIALGTSLPELAVTLAGIGKGRNAIALGNIIGSCTFNIVLILGLSALINPIPVDAEMRHVTLPTMVATGLALALFMRTGWRLVRLEGAVLFGLYIIFLGYHLARMCHVL